MLKKMKINSPGRQLIDKVRYGHSIIQQTEVNMTPGEEANN